MMQPGAKDGDTKLVKEGDGSVAAYGWSLSAGTWEKIGTVVEAPQAGVCAWCGTAYFSGDRWGWGLCLEFGLVSEKDAG